MEILHITAHLGGGVGKVLSHVVEASAHNRCGVHHTIACLEVPEKTQFVDHVRYYGGDLLICPSLDELTVRASEADIVQVEWWHHPAVASWLGRSALPAMRLVVWSHVSGLHPPEIPPDFVIMPHRFLFTSPCSWEHPRLTALGPEVRQRVGAVFSSGGFDDLPDAPLRLPNEPLRVGYVGTLNFAKLHPRLLDFLAAVHLPGFRLSLVGDPTTGTNLLNQATIRGIADRLDMRGYTTDVAAELAQFNVFAYLLNPLHYGTTENALLEAMAMGVVPIVLDNPAERYLVQHGETGLVVDSPITFTHALAYLAAYPEERLRLSTNASREVRERFSIQRTARALQSHYHAVLEEEKRLFDFRPVFGITPADWFRICQGVDTWRFPEDEVPEELLRVTEQGPHYLYEKTKSSVFHYRDVYPNDQRLQRWARQLEAIE